MTIQSVVLPLSQNKNSPTQCFGTSSAFIKYLNKLIKNNCSNILCIHKELNSISKD